jgi:hypothetical protein
MAKDTQWLLDFPKNGYIQINSDVWNFTRHGAGIIFFMNGSNTNEIIDAHNNIGCPELVNTWRLSKYFSLDDESQIRTLLDDMASSGELEKVSDKLYRLKDIST